MGSFSCSKQSLLLFLWAIQPLTVLLFSRYTLYPNQLYVMYGFFLSISTIFVFRDFVKIIKIQAKWLTLVVGYAVTFIVVSAFGVDFDTALKYQVLYLPLIALDFFVAFAIGFKLHEQRVFKYIISVGAVSIIYLVVDFFLFSSAANYVPTLNMAMTIPVAILSGFSSAAAIGLVVIVASTKKTITVITMIAFALAHWVKIRKKIVTEFYETKVKQKIAAMSLIGKILSIIVAAALVVFLFQNIQTTAIRFLVAGKEDDPHRALIALTSYRLLFQYFPYGIGLGGFSSLTKADLNYETVDLRGEVSAGANLHNSYMTWALEGGLPILIIVLILFFLYFRAARFLFRNDKSRLLGAVTLIWMLQGMIFAVAQQWHNSVAFWPLFGFTFGCYERYRRIT